MKTKPHSYSGTSSGHLRALKTTIFSLTRVEWGLEYVHAHPNAGIQPPAASTHQGACTACFPSPALMQAACPIFPTVIKEVSPGIPLCSMRTHRDKKGGTSASLWSERCSRAMAGWALMMWCHCEYGAYSVWIVQQDVYAIEHLWMSRIL